MLWFAIEQLPETLPDNLFGLVAVLGPVMITAVGGVLVAKVSAQHREAKETAATVKDTAQTVETVREQVQNSHDTNMRDDIDELKDAVVWLRNNVATAESVSLLHRDQQLDRERLNAIEETVTELARREAG
ncbi:DUF2746 domain-containing protein [Mycolicibacterium fortuitum]|uniref:DUF2746 domain-containing protein n=1 Tax=Mycolicibacterium fortuitum TaxID=1766 RepID=UPI002615DC41|nr:DUF2746 domain-containing protein [Mycolicibacterium fortuitum]